jgi:hypothetical protein
VVVGIGVRHDHLRHWLQRLRPGPVLTVPGLSCLPFRVGLPY